MDDHVMIERIPSFSWQTSSRKGKGTPANLPVSLEKTLEKMRKIEQRSFPKEDSMAADLEAEIKKRTNVVFVAYSRRAPVNHEDRRKGEHVAPISFVDWSAVGFLLWGNNAKQEGCSRVLKVDA